MKKERHGRACQISVPSGPAQNSLRRTFESAARIPTAKSLSITTRLSDKMTDVLTAYPSGGARDDVEAPNISRDSRCGIDPRDSRTTPCLRPSTRDKTSFRVPDFHTSTMASPKYQHANPPEFHEHTSEPLVWPRQLEKSDRAWTTQSDTAEPPSVPRATRRTCRSRRTIRCQGHLAIDFRKHSNGATSIVNAHHV